MDLGVPMEFQQGSQAWSHVETCKSAFFSSCNSIVRLPVKLTFGSVSFSRGVTRLSHMPSSSESILGPRVESVQGNQVYLDWLGTSGSVGIVAGPLEFLSSFKLRPPPLEVRRECQDSFPDEAGKWTLISR